ncbi:amino acid transporter [Lindgomyces ingoldianus]|uniref:Amino acid transporter n=1 Tax=Lindgomyces ingoldianus TaxID=673940 RepID=A0ACB6QAU3_9PLEO|nr:amino acid transporter [Lindgomyces ingoldianus]KAF2463265.1 amino acid transporter [Lindgomyces ingoldianus]
MEDYQEQTSPDHMQEREGGTRKAGDDETEPLLQRRTSTTSSHGTHRLPKQLSTRHAFAVLVSIQIGSGIFASPAQVDGNVPSPGAALLVWALGGLLSWAGAASFAELGAALPLNGGTQEYLRRVYGDTMAFLMAWVYIMAVKPSSMAIQSIVIAESIGSVSSATALTGWKLKAIATSAFVSMVIVNSINTKTTMKLNESFTIVKITTVVLVVVTGLTAVIAHLINPASPISGSKDWFTKDWFSPRHSIAEGRPIDWTSIGAWERYGHYSTAIYAGLWAYDGWDNANFVASEINDPGRALPRAIKAAMAVVLSCYELVNIAYYILLPWDTMSSNDAVAVAAAKSLLGRPAGIFITILVAISCAGSITSNVFSVGRLTVAAAQRHYLPNFLSSRRFIPLHRRQISEPENVSNYIASENTLAPSTSAVEINTTSNSPYDAPIPANILALMVTLAYIITGSFQGLLIFVGMAEWVFYVSAVIGLLILRHTEPELHRPYRPMLVLPIVFVIIGTLVITRSAMFAPVQSGVLAGLLVVGTLISHLRG